MKASFLKTNEGGAKETALYLVKNKEQNTLIEKIYKIINDIEIYKNLSNQAPYLRLEKTPHVEIAASCIGNGST